MKKQGLSRKTSEHIPLISVITVVFNGAQTLRLTLDSIVQNLNENIEYIIIDGGSTDGTREIIADYCRYISLSVSEPDKGIYDAMNKGLGLASGEYIYFINSGDTLISDQTLVLVSRLLEDRPTLLMNRVRGISTEGVRLLPRCMGLGRVRDTFLSGYCHQAAFVRRDAYLAAGGFDLGYRHFADFKALWTIRSQPDCWLLETQLEVANFPLDGVSSDWRRAAILAKERERLLIELGDPTTAWQSQVRILRARLYTLRMMLYSRFTRCT